MSAPYKLGFFIPPVHPPARAYADVLREDRWMHATCQGTPSLC